MQIDFHYYATYAMARCAGFDVQHAQTLATAAQFVDDNAARKFTDFDDGSYLSIEATAHHIENIKNFDDGDQRNVWVPFHFLPAGDGHSLTEKLICKKDSAIAQEMRDNHLAQSDKPYFIELLGVMAHVYGDTFSHYGFSGVSSRWNRVVNGSIDHRTKDDKVRAYLGRKADSFIETYGLGIFQNIKSCIAQETGALGHGPVLTYPDRPFLEWRFEYERSGDSGWRNNRDTFLEYCRILHEKLSEVVEANPQYAFAGAKREWADIEGVVRRIIAFEGPKEERIAQWRNAAQNGLFKAKEVIPAYEDWNETFDDLDGQESANDLIDKPLYRFYQAASYHRWYVLRDLLPRHGIVVN